MIINVEMLDDKTQVTYDTGTQRAYPSDKLPKTVQKWIEAHREPIREAVEPEMVNTATEDVEVRKKAEICVYGEPTEVAAVQMPVEEMSVEDPEPVRVTITPVAAAQLAGLFLAGVAVYMVWWHVQAIIAVINAVDAANRAAQKAVKAVRKAWSIVYPPAAVNARKLAYFLRSWAREAWAWREELVTAETVIG